MGDNSNVKIDITADASGTEPGFSQTEAKLDHLGRSSGKLASEYSGLDAATKKMTSSMSAAAGDTHKLDAELTALLTRINPAYAAVRNLDQGTDLLHRGLASGLITTQQYNSSIGLLEASFAKANRATAESAFMTNRAKQEMVVLGRELAAGNFSRMPGTLSIIAQGLSPVAWGIAGVTAALVAGGYAWWKWGEDAREATDAARKGADAAKESADRAQQLTQMEKLADISEKIGKLERDKADLAEKSKRLGLAGGGGKGELFAYQETIEEKQREIAGLQRQAANLWDEIEKAQKRAAKQEFTGEKFIGGPNDSEPLPSLARMQELERAEFEHQNKLEEIKRRSEERRFQISKTFGVSMVQFEKQTGMQRAQTMAAGLENMTAIGAQKNRELFEINKVASIANATISGIQAVQDSFAFGAKWGGPIGGAAMAAIAVAATMANIAAINSTQFGGGSMGALGGAPGIPSQATSGMPVSLPPPASAVPAQAPQQFNLTIVGAKQNPDAPIMSYNALVEQFLPMLEMASNNGAVKFNLVMG